MGIIIAMFIWSGSAFGGAAVIQGFESMSACERARPVFEEKHTKEFPNSDIFTFCISLNSGD